MSIRTSCLLASLLGLAAVTGCAQIIGADFDRPASEGGGGGATTSSSANASGGGKGTSASTGSSKSSSSGHSTTGSGAMGGGGSTSSANTGGTSHTSSSATGGGGTSHASSTSTGSGGTTHASSSATGTGGTTHASSTHATTSTGPACTNPATDCTKQDCKKASCVGGVCDYQGNASDAGNVCTGGFCDASGHCTDQCSDTVKDGGETDVDCGGGNCQTCGDGKGCKLDQDCTSGACDTSSSPHKCKAAGCSTDNDCPAEACQTASCPSGSCVYTANAAAAGTLCAGTSTYCDASGTCVDECSDTVADGGESAVDCGGPCGATCQNGQTCSSNGDCASGNCDTTQTPAICAIPGCDSATDCAQIACQTAIGCTAHVCDYSLASPGTTCAGGGYCDSLGNCGSQCNDGVKDGNETGADCGGGTCPGCQDGVTCTIPSDCDSGYCSVECGPWANAISAGGLDTCALLTFNNLVCWGDNPDGELGNGTGNESALPVPVNGFSSNNVQSVSVGGNSACALDINGGAKCWGRNDSGQLGNNSSNNSSVPVAVQGLSSGVAQISAGYSHGCAVLTAGTVLCWGDNTYGQLGTGSTNSSLAPITAVLNNVQTIDASPGGNFTCAVDTTGAASCWGDNLFGELGDGTTNHGFVCGGDDCSLDPVGVAGFSSGVETISAGPIDACLLTTSGAVWCWGDNEDGQLGDGTMGHAMCSGGDDCSFSPVQVVGLDSGVSRIAVGWGTACAVVAGGGVQCWGDNSYGQLGDDVANHGGFCADDCSLVPVDVVGLPLGGAVDVTVGDLWACALLASGGVKCWGYGEFGQLGNGGFADSAPLVYVTEQ